MPRELLLLTGVDAAATLPGVIADALPDGVGCSAVSSLEDLERRRRDGLAGIRLISFCTMEVVPTGILGALDLEPYNIHPGPPQLPGVYPEAFGIYEGFERFAATVHVITEDLDAGPIVSTRGFDVSADWNREDLAKHVFQASLELLFEVALACGHSDAPLPRADIPWSGKARTRREYDALCERTPDPAEHQRRQRSFAPDYPRDSDK